MRPRQLLVAAAAAALLVPVGAATAQAVVPSNDTPSGATVVSALPDTVTQSTVEATTDSIDAALNEQCGAPATNGSVWFSYEDTTGNGIVVDVSASGFSAGVMIVVGDPATDGTVVSCAPGAAAARGDAGTTYYVMAFSDTPGVQGGELVATFSDPGPAPGATLTVDRRATAYRDGSLRLTGTYSCTNADGYSSDIEGNVVQRVGRFKITGFFFVYPLECDGATHSWEAYVTSDTGLFSGGKATSVSLIFACGLLDCTVVEVEQNLMVTRSRG